MSLPAKYPWGPFKGAACAGIFQGLLSPSAWLPVPSSGPQWRPVPGFQLKTGFQHRISPRDGIQLVRYPSSSSSAGSSRTSPSFVMTLADLRIFLHLRAIGPRVHHQGAAYAAGYPCGKFHIRSGNAPGPHGPHGPAALLPPHV